MQRLTIETLPAAVVLDWDNTLVDTWPVIHRALSDTFVAMGLEPWTLQETRARARASAREAFPLLFGNRSAEAEAVFYRAMEAHHLKALAPLAGAEELLRMLSRAAIPTAVVSNKRGWLLRREATHLGWGRYFHAIVGANDAEHDKPAPDPVHLALEGSGIEAGPKVWFVGDTDIDIVCAVAAGCLPVLLRAEPPGEGEFGASPPALHLGDCGALARFLESLAEVTRADRG